MAKLPKRVMVAGSGSFPVDMLRYDRCFPFSQNDVTTAFCIDEQRTVELSSDSGRDYTAGRWKSFGWRII